MFAFQKGFHGREINALLFAANQRDQKWVFRDHPDERPEGFIPVGSVEWVEQSIGQRKPDYYPEFTKKYWGREIWQRNEWEEVVKDTCEKGLVFIKPADRHKRFEAGLSNFMTRSRVEPDEQEYSNGPYWCSGFVKFVNEWRYYVANGEVLCGWWYQGDNDTGRAPELPSDLEIPFNFCGALDFGVTGDGKFRLVENNLPYAIGWYGPSSENDKYYQFITEGWNYLNQQ